MPPRSASVRAAPQGALKSLGAKDAVLFVADLRSAPRAAWAVRQTILCMPRRVLPLRSAQDAEEARRAALAAVTLAIAGRARDAAGAGCVKEAVATADGTDLARTSATCRRTFARPPTWRTSKEARAAVSSSASRSSSASDHGETRHGRAARRDALFAPAAKLIVAAYAGARQEQEAAGPGRQGHHLR